VDPERGISWTLLGTNEDALRQLLADLGAARRGPTENRTVARIYGGARGQARDPRTGAVLSHARAALEGNLQTFLDAFRPA
jgi:hypothetical protein